MLSETQGKLDSEDVIWNLKELYSGSNDHALIEDIHFCQQKAADLADKYSGKLSDLESEELLALIIELEEVETIISKLGTYAYLNFTTQTGNQEGSALLQKIEEVSAEVGQKLVFFKLEWNTLSTTDAQKHLTCSVLNKYQHYLKAMRRFAPYQLSTKEEELLQSLSPIGRNSWNLLFDKLMGQLRFGETGKTEEEVLSELHHPQRQVRKNAAGEMTAELQKNNHLLAHIFNTLASEKMIVDRLRGYSSWSREINLTNELEDKTVETLITAVTSRYSSVEQYYKYKKDILGYEELFDYDRYAPIPGGDSSLISWGKCRDIVIESFSDFSQQAGEIVSDFFTKKWIHAPIIEGKRGGAFAHPCVPDVHPYIMVNYAGTMRDVSTVAHELGHGMHQVLAAEQGFYNSDTSLVLAETASVFAEFLVFKTQLKLIDSVEEQRAFICQKLESIFATVFRQVAMNRFEHQMHTRRREQGELSTSVFGAVWLQTQSSMFGDSVTLTEDYGSWWSYIPHFLSTPGYVYSYAFGELLVLALYSLYQQEGESFVTKYLGLLSSGGSRSPYELLEPFGIDLNDPQFWQGGLDIIESLFDTLTGLDSSTDN